MEQPPPSFDDLLDLAADLVINDSLSSVTIRSLALRLELTEDELLDICPSLTDLLVGMVEREYSEMFRVVLDNVERDPLGGLLSRIYRYTFTAIYERPLARTLYLSDPIALNSIMRSSFGFDRMPELGVDSRFIHQMQVAGMVRDDIDPIWVSSVLGALAAGIALTSPHDDLDDIIDGAALMLDRAVDARVEDTSPGKAAFIGYAAMLAGGSRRR